MKAARRRRIIDIEIVVITGVSPKSLGETLAHTIANHAPACLILASRTPSKLESVLSSIKQSTPGADPKLIELDLGSQKSIRKAATDISILVDHVDVLINNAGVNSSDRRETSRQNGTTRVVNVSSLGYRLSPIRFHDYNFEGKSIPTEEQPPAGLPPALKPNVEEGRPYVAFCAYGQSKTANILHAVSLNKRLNSQGVKAFAVHPGCKAL